MSGSTGLEGILVRHDGKIERNTAEVLRRLGNVEISGGKFLLRGSLLVNAFTDPEDRSRCRKPNDIDLVYVQDDCDVVTQTEAGSYAVKWRNLPHIYRYEEALEKLIMSITDEPMSSVRFLNGSCGKQFRPRFTKGKSGTTDRQRTTPGDIRIPLNGVFVESTFYDEAFPSRKIHFNLVSSRKEIVGAVSIDVGSHSAPRSASHLSP